MKNSNPVVYQLGSWPLRSGRRVNVSARVTIDPFLEPTPEGEWTGDERVELMDDIMPLALVELRRELAVLRWRPGGWEDVEEGP